jgi:hypothetical protein
VQFAAGGKHQAYDSVSPDVAAMWIDAARAASG